MVKSGFLFFGRGVGGLRSTFRSIILYTENESVPTESGVCVCVHSFISALHMNCLLNLYFTTVRNGNEIAGTVCDSTFGNIFAKLLAGFVSNG